jgi:hypothetical protein
MLRQRHRCVVTSTTTAPSNKTATYASAYTTPHAQHLQHDATRARTPQPQPQPRADAAATPDPRISPTRALTRRARPPPPPTLGVYSTNLAPVDAAAHARTTTCDRPPLTPLTPRAAVAAPQPPLARAHRAPPPTPPRSQSPLPMGRSHCVVPTAYTHPSPASHIHALPHAKPERSPPLPARAAASTRIADAHPYAKPTPNRGLAHLHHRRRQPAAAAASRVHHTRTPCARDSPRARATPQATASLAVACCHDNDMWARAIRRS